MSRGGAEFGGFRLTRRLAFRNDAPANRNPSLSSERGDSHFAIVNPKSQPLMKNIVKWTLLVAAISLGGGAAFGEKKISISEIMEQGFKGNGSLVKKIENGEATEADIETLAGYIAAMHEDRPTVGDADSWVEKTTALVAAIGAVKEGKPEAAAVFKTAANCKACHDVHRD